MMPSWIKQLFSSPDKTAAITAAQVDDGSTSKQKGDASLGNGDFAAAANHYRQAIACNPNLAKAHSNLGFALRELGKFDEARQSLKQALRIDATIADAHYMLALLLQGENDLDAAQQHLRQAIALQPDFEFAYHALCILLFQRGQLEEAKQLILDGIRHIPRSTDLHYFLGNLYNEQQQLDQAQDSYRTALSIAPERTDILTNLGLALLKHKHTEAALDVFRKALILNPNLADVHCHAGNAMYASGHIQDAVSHYQQALAIDSSSVEIQYNLANALRELGQFDDAASNYKKVVAIRPDFADAYNNLGYTLQNSGQVEDAIVSFRAALNIKPEFAEAYNNLGNALRSLKKFDEARDCFQQAIHIAPQFAEAHSNLGNVLHDMRELELALASYRQALQIHPDYAQVHNNLGNVLSDLNQLDAAMRCFQRALQLMPDYAEAQNNLGNILLTLGRIDEAIACFRQALRLNPEYADAYSNLGNALRRHNQPDQLEEAERCYRKAIEINPNTAALHNNIGDLLLANGHMHDAIACFREALRVQPDFFAAHTGILFTYNFLNDKPSPVLFEEAQYFGREVAKNCTPYTVWNNTRDTNRRLKIGLVSSDFRQHPVGYFLESIFAALKAGASDQVELIAYYNHHTVDDVTRHLMSCCSAWHNVVNISDQNLARQIHDECIDILIDLNGHTAQNRLPLFTWKPAPIQATWLGYFPTTGVDAIDYRIADPWVPPPEEECYFTEKIYRLPETYVCFTPPHENLPVSPLPALTNDSITFGSLNNLAKINDEVVALWARILHALPNSCLLMKTSQLSIPALRQESIERFSRHGIAANRLILEGGSPRREHLAAYQRVDIALDPFPLPGGTTSVESLWMGVPVLTLAGERFLSRIGESTMQNAGLPEWIAFSADDYVEKAVQLATDIQSLAALRERLRQQVLTSPLFDAPRFAQHFAAGMRDMWMQWCQQQ